MSFKHHYVILKRHSFFILLVLKICTFGFADYMLHNREYSNDSLAIKWMMLFMIVCFMV